jgi:hypothetical protein
VSRAYSGTGALKTDFTRTGVRTKAGAVADLSNSIARYFRNNFGDGPRQDAYDLFLGAYLPSAATTSSSLLFVDRRPTVIRIIPYALCGAILLEAAAFGLRDLTDGGLLSTIGVFALLGLTVALWTANFIMKHGMLYVNWPKLNVPVFAIEGYSEELSKATKDRLVGRWIIGRRGSSSSSARERGASTNGSSIRLIHLEEGKKRIE